MSLNPGADAVPRSAGRRVAIVGNSGAGKSTLARALAETGRFPLVLESQDVRPFHARLAGNEHRAALANQIDFLLHRAEQEAALEQEERLVLIDGGLELDFWGFTHLFHRRGLLDDEELALCTRLYRLIRRHQPPPSLFIHLHAPATVIADRYVARGRVREVTRLEDLSLLEALLAAWLAAAPAPVLTLDAREDDYLQPASLAALRREIDRRVAGGA